ncbi:hypothetical protein QBC38DRAFT_489325 [Podospora fimiseda]|uniref:Uncharacterized protein n=1 Tax=Podospora fimiseda TaxID=252190 RepID=A0AAN6YQ86_9PEZI|nr:hypothetical protein QBC38DRAFT_489325 [Podospora fimiseda]
MLNIGTFFSLGQVSCIFLSGQYFSFHFNTSFNISRFFVTFVCNFLQSSYMFVDLLFFFLFRSRGLMYMNRNYKKF